MSGELVLSLSHVYSGYQDGGGLFGKRERQEVLHDVTFDVRHGEILGLVGESGTGKSTLAKGPLQLPQPLLQRGVDPGGAPAGLRQIRQGGAEAPGPGDAGPGGAAGGVPGGQALGALRRPAPAGQHRGGADTAA